MLSNFIFFSYKTLKLYFEQQLKLGQVKKKDKGPILLCLSIVPSSKQIVHYSRTLRWDIRLGLLWDPYFQVCGKAKL